MAPLPDASSTSDLGLATLIAGWTFAVLTLCSLSTVLWSRRLSYISYDVLLIMFATLVAIVIAAQTTWAVLVEGQGHDLEDETPTQAYLVIKSIWSNEILWGIANTTLRVSILLSTKNMFFLDVVRGRTACIILIVISVLNGIAIVLQIFAMCRPLSAAWNPYTQGNCGNETLAYLIVEVTGLLIDVVIMAIPIPAIISMQISTLRKLKWISLLCLGAIVIVVTGLRIAAIHMIQSTNITYTKGYLGLLSTLGTFLSIITCCIPLSLPALQKLWAMGISSLATCFRLRQMQAAAAANMDTHNRRVPIDIYVFRLMSKLYRRIRQHSEGLSLSSTLNQSPPLTQVERGSWVVE